MSSDQTYDLVVVGAGPGGYVAAVRGAQLGLRVAIVEKEYIGGTCLNVGCIPSKALLDATHLLAQIRRASTFGIQVGEVSVDYPTMQKRKAKVVKMLTTGVRGLLRKHGVDSIEGEARFEAPGALLVAAPNGDVSTLHADNIIIATGSVEAELPTVPFDHDLVVSSRGALEFDSVPERLVVVGGGYIGLELGSVYARLGTEVVVLEMMDRVLPEMDPELSATAYELLTAEGLDIRLGARVSGVQAVDGGAEVAYQIGDESQAAVTDKVLVSIGRRPNTATLGLSAIGLEPDERGFIAVDHGMRTGVPGVYAVGDVVPTMMLAHVAMDEGVVAAECVAGRNSAMEYDAIPAVVFTSPEIASVGLKEDEAELRGHRIKVGRFPFRANGRARAREELEGWVKIIADADSDAILGVHCIGAEAGHLIHEAVVAMGYNGYAEDLALTVHAHPTLSEAFKEAALAVAGRALHV